MYNNKMMRIIKILYIEESVDEKAGIKLILIHYKPAMFIISLKYIASTFLQRATSSLQHHGNRIIIMYAYLLIINRLCMHIYCRR